LAKVSLNKQLNSKYDRSIRAVFYWVSDGGEMKNAIEKRTFNAEVRKLESGDKPQITGTASVFNQLSQDLGGFREIIEPYAFGDIINTCDVFALINHDPNQVLGRNKSGTLKLEENENGLDFTVDPPDTTFANDLLVSMARKDIDKCSFAFIVADDSWETINGEDIRRIKKFKELFDVSVVTYPAFYQTNAQVNGKDVTPPEEVYAEFRSKNNIAQIKQEPVIVRNNDKLKIYEQIMKGK